MSKKESPATCSRRLPCSSARGAGIGIKTGESLDSPFAFLLPIPNIVLMYDRLRIVAVRHLEDILVDSLVA